MNQIGPFDLRVLEIVSRIPIGKLATYGQIADLVGSFGCARQGGWALRRLPLHSSVPWHRVVNAKGEISMSIGRNGTDSLQRELLISEQIFIDDHFKLSLKQHLWKPELSSFIYLDIK